MGYIEQQYPSVQNSHEINYSHLNMPSFLYTSVINFKGFVVLHYSSILLHLYNYSILLFYVILCKYIDKKSNTQLHLFSLSFLAFSGSNSSQVHHFGLQHVSNCTHSIHVMRLDVLINRLIKNCPELRKRNAYNIHKDLFRYN